MNILILGGGGLIGQKLTRKLADLGQLRGRAIDTVTLADVVMPAPVEAGFPVKTVACDMRRSEDVAGVLSADIDVIFLLAAVVSAQAEADFDAGYQTNLHGTLAVLERARALGTRPVVVFSSSIVAFGGDVPDAVDDETHLNPQTSYGTQKAIGEMLINDYSRKGSIDCLLYTSPSPRDA